jgi:hypothetical protein
VISGFGGAHLLIALLYYVVLAAALFGILYLAVRLAVTHVLRKYGLIPPAATNRATPPTD